MEEKWQFVKVQCDTIIVELKRVNATVISFCICTAKHFITVFVFVTWIRQFDFILVNLCRQVGNSALWLDIS